MPDPLWFWTKLLVMCDAMRCDEMGLDWIGMVGWVVELRGEHAGRAAAPALWKTAERWVYVCSMRPGCEQAVDAAAV